MATILVTVMTSSRRVDLALPGDVPLAQLVPGVAAYFADDWGAAGIIWALAPVGRSPFPADTSLAECGIVDGTVLQLQAVGRAAPAADAPGGDGADPRTASVENPGDGDPAHVAAAAAGPSEWFHDDDTPLIRARPGPATGAGTPEPEATRQGEVARGGDQPGPPAGRPSMSSAWTTPRAPSPPPPDTVAPPAPGGPANWPPEPEPTPASPPAEPARPNPWGPASGGARSNGPGGPGAEPQPLSPDELIGTDSPSWERPADAVWTRRGFSRREASEALQIPGRLDLPQPPTDPMHELDEAMASPGPRGVTPGVRAVGKAPAANTTLTTSIGFLALVIAGAVLGVRQGLALHRAPVQVIALIAAVAGLALYYGGLKYGLLEPLLERVPGGERLLHLGGRTSPTVRAPLTQAEIAERLERLAAVVEDFMYDLALLLAGHNPPLGYVDHRTAQDLRANVAPFLRSGQRLTPNFGHHGEMKVHWDPDNDEDPVRCEVTFDDMSTRETDDGERIVGTRRRILVTLELDPTISRVLRASLEPAPSQDHTGSQATRSSA